jgi:CBS domain-containing protein
VLAPLLIMGGSVGALCAPLAPAGDARLWALVGMGAIMGGTMRSPLTGVVFALELTQDVNALPALLIASVAAHGFTVLLMRRSILTEKVARRGYHVSREYTVDPLEMLNVGGVMTREVVAVPASTPVRELLGQYFYGAGRQKHQAYPVVDPQGHLVGVVSRADLPEDWWSGLDGRGPDPSWDLIIAYDLVRREPVTVYPWESCRSAAERMAFFEVGRLPVVSPEDPRKVVGVVTRSDLLKARARQVEEEMKRERFLLGQEPGA